MRDRLREKVEHNEKLRELRHEADLLREERNIAKYQNELEDLGYSREGEEVDEREQEQYESPEEMLVAGGLKILDKMSEGDFDERETASGRSSDKVGKHRAQDVEHRETSELDVEREVSRREKK